MKVMSIFNKRQLKDIDFNRWLLISLALIVVGLLLALLIAPEITQCVVKYVSPESSPLRTLNYHLFDRCSR